MPFRYTCNILDRLRDAGYTTYKIRKDGILSESTVQKLRAGTMISLDQIGVVCDLLHCQPWNLIEYIPQGDIDGGGRSGGNSSNSPK